VVETEAPLLLGSLSRELFGQERPTDRDWASGRGYGGVCKCVSLGRVKNVVYVLE
jgi:hypothetical protein